MTNVKLCGKMLFMNTITRKKFYILLLSVVCAVAFAFACLPTLTLSFSANAQDLPKTELFLPHSDVEYYSLSNPIDVYADDSVTAIVQDDQSLIVYYNGEFKVSAASFDAIKQVKKFDDDTLIISDNGPIYKINIETLDKTVLLDADNKPVGANFFDINDNYLVTAYSDSVFIYALDGDHLNSPISFKANGDCPIAINDANEIFYINSNGALMKKVASDLTNETLILPSASPTKMIADENFIYYIQGKIVYRVSLADFRSAQLSVNAHIEYDLGNLASPVCISFKDGNVLIADTELDAVQEFAVVDNSLEFTGFAIASGKTAYNRTTVSAISIDKQGDSVAVLDNDKLSIFTPVNADKYSKNNFNNFHNTDLGETALPGEFALGEKSALLSYNHRSSYGSFFKLINLNDSSVSTQFKVFDGNIIEDITYQSGFYYVLATESTKTHVYKLNEKNLLSGDYNFEEQLFEAISFDATLIAADVFGNVYLANQVTGEIKLYCKANNYESSLVATKSGLTKLSTDLGGKLYALCDGALYYFNGTELSALTLSPLVNGDLIKSFAMDFDKKEIYLLYNNKEYVCETTELNNLALSEVVAPAEYVTTAKTAALENLSFATIADGANVYSVVKNGDKFDYNGLTNATDEYVVICDIVVDSTLTLTALAQKNGIVLVNSAEVTKYQPTVDTAPAVAFIATDVCAYYLPIITPDMDYALFDNQRIRLSKISAIMPKGLITIKTVHKDQVNDVQFYFAEFTVGSETCSGYIPLSFTVPVLSKDFVWESYSIEKIMKTTIYADQELTNELTSFDGGNVRLIAKNGGVALISVNTADGWVTGYIHSQAILNEPNVAVRNILIILAVTASVCGTSTYFILRKKD